MWRTKPPAHCLPCSVTHRPFGSTPLRPPSLHSKPDSSVVVISDTDNLFGKSTSVYLLQDR